MFRESARGRGKLADRPIENLTALEDKAAEHPLTDIFTTMGSDRTKASELLLGYLNQRW